MNKKQIVGVLVFVVLVLVIMGIRFFTNGSKDINLSRLTTVYVATGGGKEDFLADSDVVKILKKKYKLNVVLPSGLSILIDV